MSKNKQAVQKTLNKIFKPSTVKIISLSIALISLTLLIALTQQVQDVRKKAQTPASFTFNGNRMDYAVWVRDNHGAFNINDDDNMCSPLVNDALLWLAFGDTNAKKRYHDQMFHLKNIDYDFPDNGQKQIADVFESYLYMRDENTFTVAEQRELEPWFRDKVNYLRSLKGARYQAVGAGMAAIAAHVLNTTNTGYDFSSDVNALWGYSRTANSFNDEPDGWSPHQNSAHYAATQAMSSLRVAIYNYNGQYIKEDIHNFIKLVEWLITTYPHNGDTLAYGVTWGRNHLRPTFNVLLAASYYLKDYDPELAANSKWLATQMFRYYLTHNQEVTWTNHPAGRFEANPMYVWRYLNDDQPSYPPSPNRFGSAVVRRYIALDQGGWDFAVGVSERLDKIVHRNGWNNGDLYLQVDMAPPNHKTRPYANSITQITYGGESFSTDHTSEGNEWESSWWQERNVALAGGWDVDNAFEANLISFSDNTDYSESVTEIFGWTRRIRLYKTGDVRIEVIDTMLSLGQVYWHFQGNPTWKPGGDGVVLEKNGVEMDVSWTGTSTHQLVDTLQSGRCCGWEWGYTGRYDQQVVLSGANQYTTIFRPTTSTPTPTPTGPTNTPTITPTVGPTLTPTETPPVTPYPNSCSGITYYVNPSPEPNTTVTVNINRSGANSCFGNWNNVGLLLDGVPMGVNICYADGLNCNAGYHAYVNSGSSGTHLLQFSVNNNSCWCNSTTFTTQSLITNTPTPSITPTSIPTHTITPTPPPVPGDANGDGRVTIADYIIWLNHYGMSTGNGPQDGDFDSSGSVGIADYIIWLNNYGT